MHFVAVISLLALIDGLSGHGYLLFPPSRNSMWRLGYDNPANYNDMQLFCGGFWKQYGVNEGKCGVCGDDASEANQQHMDGQKFGSFGITAVYKKGDIIDVDVKITAAHRGYMEFRIGEFNDKPTTGDNLGYLNGDLMEFENGDLKMAVTTAKMYQFKLKLPADLTCTRCVMQWRYRTGNNWGCGEENGVTKCGLGHGNQETFVNCADVAIEEK